MHGSPALREARWQLWWRELELLVADGVGEHLSVRVLLIGLGAQLKELP